MTTHLFRSRKLFSYVPVSSYEQTTEHTRFACDFLSFVKEFHDYNYDILAYSRKKVLFLKPRSGMSDHLLEIGPALNSAIVVLVYGKQRVHWEGSPRTEISNVIEQLWDQMFTKLENEDSDDE